MERTSTRWPRGRWLPSLLVLTLGHGALAAAAAEPAASADTAPPRPVPAESAPALDAGALDTGPAAALRSAGKAAETLEELRGDCARSAARALAGSSGGEPQACDLLVAQLELSAAPAPKLAEALANRAVIFARMGEGELALADLDRAAAARPADPVLTLNRSFVLLHGDRPQDALALLDPLIGQGAAPAGNRASLPAPPPEWLAPALVNRALVLRSLGDDDGAAADLRRAQRLLSTAADRRHDGAPPARSVPEVPGIQPAPAPQ